MRGIQYDKKLLGKDVVTGSSLTNNNRFSEVYLVWYYAKNVFSRNTNVSQEYSECFVKVYSKPSYRFMNFIKM